MVVRIMLMVPIYAISSLISLFSLEAAFVIDAIRDIYEVCYASSKLPIRSRWLSQAFVIYCFFQLLVGYLGGERSLLIRVHGRQPKATPFPMNVFQRELDLSDPFTFLFLKRGILRMSLTSLWSSRPNLDSSRICSSQAVPCNRFARVESLREI